MEIHWAPSFRGDGWVTKVTYGDCAQVLGEEAWGKRQMKMKQDQRLGGLGGLAGRAWVVFENWMEHHLFVLMRFYFEHFKVDLVLMVLKAYIEISNRISYTSINISTKSRPVLSTPFV